MENNKVLNALLRNSLSSFTQKSFATYNPIAAYKHNWHIDLMAEYLEACYERKIKRLIINIAPRCGKSLSVSTAFPAWVLGKDPKNRFLVASSGDKLTRRLSRDTKAIMDTDWYKEIFPSTIIGGGPDNETLYKTTAGGARQAVTTGQKVTGDGGNFLIVDDPTDASDAGKENARETINDWFDGTFLSRLDDKENDVIIIVMQRLHEDDLTGHLLAKGGWEHLVIPAEFEEDTTYTYPMSGKEITMKAGESFFEDRLPLRVLERTALEMGSYMYNGQYMQRPAPVGGGFFQTKDFRQYLNPAKYKWIIHSWDTSFKAKGDNDPSVCTIYGVKDNLDADLLRVFKEKMEYPQLRRTAMKMAEDDQPDYILIEDAASGQVLIQDMKAETKFNIMAIKTKAKSKEDRANTAQGYIEAGRLGLPVTAPWLEAYIYEMSTFPVGSNDDQVDSTTQLINWLKMKERRSFGSTISAGVSTGKVNKEPFGSVTTKDVAYLP
tara:strand:+ start:3400 stop:4878 length:1479 start_codon:yes stop_codon:yes gene_type:complete